MQESVVFARSQAFDDYWSRVYTHIYCGLDRDRDTGKKLIKISSQVNNSPVARVEGSGDDTRSSFFCLGGRYLTDVVFHVFGILVTFF